MTSNGYDPRAVVNALLDEADPRGLPLSNLSIQKLLYFAHARYLAIVRKPLVAGVFEAWEYGPVCRPIYDELRKFGREPVTIRLKFRDLFSQSERDIPKITDIDVRDHLATVVRQLGAMSPSRLVELSHAKDGPWHYVWNKSQTSPMIGSRITDKITIERYPLMKVAVGCDSPIRDIFDEASPVTGN